MDCKTARHQVALLVGKDLAESDAVDLQRHLATCPKCRELHVRMKSTFAKVASVSDDVPDTSSAESLWPAISNAIAVRRVSTRNTRRFNGWVAGLAVAATVLAMVTISQNLPVTSGYDPGYGLSPDYTQPVIGPDLNRQQRPPIFPNRAGERTEIRYLNPLLNGDF